MRIIKAARIHNYGGWKAVKVEEVSLPRLRTGEVLVRVHAAGVNPIDWQIRAGYMQQTMPLSLPFTLGCDFSGVVDEISAGVTDFKVGDAIYGQAAVFTGASGSFAEAAIIRTTGSIAAKPRCVDHAEASALPLAGVSALQALTVHLRLSAGQTILIHGGGGVGSLAIQLAKHLGAHVATTVCTDQIEYVKGLGAQTVIDYKTQDFEEVVRDFDAVFDTVGGDTYIRSYKVLKRGGRIVSMLERPSQELMKELGVEAIGQSTRVTSDGLNTLANLVDQRVLKIQIAETFSPERTAEALLRVEKGSSRGRVVIAQTSIAEVR